MKEGWKDVLIGDVCFVQGGSTPRRTDESLWKDGTYPWFTVEDIRNQGRVITDTKQKVTKKAWDSLRVFPKDTILLCCTASVGEYAITKIDISSNQQFNGITIKDKTEISPMYLFYFCSTLKDKLLENSGKSTIDFVSGAKVRSLHLSYPPLPEQERIVKILDAAFEKIDRLKQNAEKSLQEVKNLWEATLRNVFIPKECWQTKTFGEVGTLERGGNFLKSDFVDNGFPCIHYGQIHMIFGTFTYNHITCIPESLAKKKAHKGDIIIAITSEDVACSCKSTAWLGDYDIAIGAHAAIYRHTLNPKFVSYFIQAPYFQKEKEKYTHGFKVVEIKPSDIAKISISYPSENEQNKIVEKLDRIFERCQNYKIKYDLEIAEYEALKQSILRKAFSGEL